MSDILVIEDELVLARSIVAFLERRGFAARFAVDAAAARTQFERQRPRLVILDYRLGRDDGMELLVWIRETQPGVEVVMMTAHGDIALAVAAMKEGARDFLTKPVPLAAIAEIATELMVESSDDAVDPTGVDRLIGRSSATSALRRQILRLAAAFPARGTRPGVMIVGPRGAGKSLAARVLHELAGGGTDRFVTCNCALLETGDGAAQIRADVARAAQGTLLLRQVGALPAGAQLALLRALDTEPAAPSLIATSETNLSGGRDLLPDLLVRLQVGWIDIPPLSERMADVLPVAEAVAQRLAREQGGTRPRFNSAARARLLEHDWPGNVTELVNCVERALLTRKGPEIGAGDIRPYTAAAGPANPDIPTLTEIERSAIRAALSHTGGNVSRAAQILGVSRDKLRYRMAKFAMSRRS